VAIVIRLKRAAAVCGRLSESLVRVSGPEDFAGWIGVSGDGPSFNVSTTSSDPNRLQLVEFSSLVT